MALRFGVCSLRLRSKQYLPVMSRYTFSSDRSSGGGEYGSGAGQGGGAGGSIREAGGSFGRREAAQEEQYFRCLQNEQLDKMKNHIDQEIKHHEEQLKHHQEAIERHKNHIQDLAKENKEK